MTSGTKNDSHLNIAASILMENTEVINAHAEYNKSIFIKLLVCKPRIEGVIINDRKRNTNDNLGKDKPPPCIIEIDSEGVNIKNRYSNIYNIDFRIVINVIINDIY